MFISPETAIKEGWITHPKVSLFEDWEDASFVSPNAIDFTLDHMFGIAFQNQFVISEAGKVMRGSSPYRPVEDRQSGIEFWKLKPDTVWDCLSDVYVSVPEGVACQLIIRSTFSRNGLFLTSGLYDSSFQGAIGFALHNKGGHSTIGVGTRVGQIIFVESQNYGQYKGGYNHEAGTHWNTSDNSTPQSSE